MENTQPWVEITFSPRYRRPTVADAPNILRSQLEGGLLERVEFNLEGPEGIAVLRVDAGNREERELVEQVSALISGPYYVERTNYSGNHSYGQPR